MIFSKKTKLIFYLLVVSFSTYIGYILGNAFCVDNCSLTLISNILITNIITLSGLFVLIKHFGAHSCAAQPHNEILSYFENERILDLFIDAGINFRSEGHLMSVENVNKMIS